MPSDNPFSEPEDSDRTQIIRPLPGGRARSAAPPAAAAPPPGQPALPPAAVSGPDEAIRVGRSPLLAAAAPLLQLLSRLRNTLSQPDSGRFAGARGERSPPVRASLPRQRGADRAVASGALRLVRQPGRRGAGHALGQRGGVGVAVPGLDLPSGGAQRRPVLRRAEPGEAEPRLVPARAGTDVPLPLAGISGPLPAVAARPGGTGPDAGGCLRDHRPAAAEAGSRIVAALAGSDRALPGRSGGTAGLGRRGGRVGGDLRHVRLDVVRVERWV